MGFGWADPLILEAALARVRGTKDRAMRPGLMRAHPGAGKGGERFVREDGEKYFVVDGHVHFWDASPENRNKYGEGFINCFYDYHKNLSPEEWVWPKEKYDKYTEEDMMHDLFETGYVDVAIFQPTYLTEFFPTASTPLSRTRF